MEATFFCLHHIVHRVSQNSLFKANGHPLLSSVIQITELPSFVRKDI